MPYSKASSVKISLEQKIAFRKLATRLLIALVIIGILYLWVFGIFSNINNFWANIFGRNSMSDSSTISIVLPPYIYRLPAYTNKDSVEIRGTSALETRIELYLNSQKIEETIADKDSTFNFGQVKIQPGKNVFYAIAKDDNGNTSIESVDRIVSQDKEKPEIDLLNPKDGDSYENSVRTFKVYGKTEIGASVKINDQVAITDEAGNFYVMIYPSEGSNKITVEATDLAGNIEKKELFFTFNEI